MPDEPSTPEQPQDGMHKDPAVESISRRLFERQLQIVNSLLNCEENVDGNDVVLTENPDGTTVDIKEADEVEFRSWGIEGWFRNTPVLNTTTKLELEKIPGLEGDKRNDRSLNDIVLDIPIKNGQQEQPHLIIPTNVNRDIDDIIKIVATNAAQEIDFLSDPGLSTNTDYEIGPEGIKKTINMHWDFQIGLDLKQLLVSKGLTTSQFEEFTGQNVGNAKIEMPTEQIDLELISGVLAHIDGMLGANLHPKTSTQ